MDNEKPKEESLGDDKPILKLAEMVQRLEVANAKAEENLKRQEELIALNRLGGHTNAGIPQKEVIPETAKDYAKRLMSGRK